MTRTDRPTISDMLKIRSVGIIGASAGMGYYWPHSMLQWPHDLKVWLVSKSGGDVLGHKIYTSVAEVPEDFDYAIIAVPSRYVPDILKDVVKKGAKGATIFTSGYSELGTEEGRQKEEELRELIQGLPIRVLGPNCMGLGYPKMGFAFMPTIKRLSGDVGFFSQSGGVGISTYTAAVESGVGFSKLFSYGNQVDITAAEILDYFVTDGETRVIGGYVEGAKNGRSILDAMKRLAAEKPLVVLKGGRSAEGSRAVSSHTGALAGSKELWDAVFRQSNVVTVETLEDMVATLSVFSLCPVPGSRRVGIIAISGGTSVIYTDLCVEYGLSVPRTSQNTLSRLRPLIRDVGTGLGNPIDLAKDYYEDQTTSEVIRIVGEEPQFDSIIVEADIHNIHQVATIMNANDVIDGFWKALAKASAEVTKKEKKPVLVAVPEVAYPVQRTAAWNIFVQQGLPVFRNMREAIGALARVCGYYERRSTRGLQKPTK